VQFLVDTAIDLGIITNTKGHTWEYEGNTAKGKAAIPAMVQGHSLTEGLREQVFASRRGDTRLDKKTGDAPKRRLRKSEG